MGAFYCSAVKTVQGIVRMKIKHANFYILGMKPPFAFSLSYPLPSLLSNVDISAILCIENEW